MIADTLLRNAVDAGDVPGVVAAFTTSKATLYEAAFGIGIDWAGKMIEAASGMRLGAYLKQQLFDPLGMHSTAFRITPDMRSRLATVHNRAEDGGPHFGFYGPAAMPREAIERLNREVIRLLQEPVVLERFKALAVDMAEPMTPQAFAVYVRSEFERYSKLVPALGIAQ